MPAETAAHLTRQLLPAFLAAKTPDGNFPTV
jgi:hypothetical protein